MWARSNLTLLIGLGPRLAFVLAVGLRSVVSSPLQITTGGVTSHIYHDMGSIHPVRGSGEGRLVGRELTTKP